MMLKCIEFFVFGDAQLDGLRFISNLVDLNSGWDPVGRFFVDLHVDKIGILGDRFVTVAFRIEHFLCVQNLPVKRT